jgi:branched-chain amino acid transport system permease protein
MGATIWGGIVLGAVYALVATGFTLTSVPTGVFNFAQGAIVVGGSFLAYQWVAVLKWPFVVGLVLSAILGVVAGLLCELLAVRPLFWGRGALASATIVTLVGMSTIYTGLFGIKWGYQPLSVPFPGSSKALTVAGLAISSAQITLVGLAIIAPLIFHFWFTKTRRGQACLAAAEDRKAATLRGINVDLMSLTAFAVAGAFGAVAGEVTGPITYAIPTLGASLALGGFVALALGGQSSFLGGLVSGLLVGLASSFATRYLGGNWGDIGVLALLIITLAVRPRGLGGAAEVRSV